MAKILAVTFGEQGKGGEERERKKGKRKGGTKGETEGRRRRGRD